jgi:hypothetical protein
MANSWGVDARRPTTGNLNMERKLAKVAHPRGQWTALLEHKHSYGLNTRMGAHSTEHTGHREMLFPHVRQQI